MVAILNGRNSSGRDGSGVGVSAVAIISLYIDADACPVKQEIYHVAMRKFVVVG